MRAFFLTSTTARTFAYWPGRSTFPGFGNTPRASTVPVVTSTCRSRAAARPQVGEVVLDRIVELLLADRASLGQRRVAADIELRLALVGLRPLDLGLPLDNGGQGLFDLRLAGADLGVGLAQLRLRQVEPGVGLIGGGLKRPRIDLEQEVTGSDQGALLIVLAHQVSGDAGTDLGVDVPDQCPDPLRGDRHVLFEHAGDSDDRWWRDGGRAGSLAAAGERDGEHAGQQARADRGEFIDFH